MTKETISYPKADGQYIKINHTSGVTVFYYPMSGKSKSVAMIATKFGSINRRFQKLNGEWMTVPDGIAHFLEHKLFEGPNGNAFDFYAKTGAKANAYTSNDRTAYYFVTTDHFYESLEILLQFVKNPYFTPDNVEKEKGIIGQEIRMYDDEPSWCGYLALTQALYQKHPVRIDIAGTVESIARITDQTLYDCYNVFYDNPNLSLFVAGDLDLDQILKICDEKLGDARSTTICQEIPEEPDEIREKFVVKQMEVSRPQFFIGIKDTQRELDEQAWCDHETCVKVLLECLFGQSGSFYNRLYKNGLINPEFSADYECGVGYGFVLLAGESDNAQAVMSEIEKICDTFDADSISEEMFVRIRNALYGDMVRVLDNAQSMVNRFLNNRLQNCDIFSPLRALEKITRQNVVEVGKQLLNKDRMALSLVDRKESR